MGEILLNDLLNLSPEALLNTKIRFMQNNGETDPMEEYLGNKSLVNDQWLFWRTKQRYFSVGQNAISLLKLTPDTWLFTTLKRVTKELGVLGGINYVGEEYEKYSAFYGRVIVKYKKTHQGQGVNFNTVGDKLVIQQILPSIYDGDEFPGYDSVKLSYFQLSTILERGKKDWINALKSQKAVYLITDTANGKLYVGSATSVKGMLLTRWQNYIDNGHGGNVELRQLVAEKGIEYVKNNFQYSLLENYNSRVDDLYILQRESWWKNVLQTRAFGYNLN